MRLVFKRHCRFVSGGSRENHSAPFEFFPLCLTRYSAGCHEHRAFPVGSAETCVQEIRYARRLRLCQCLVQLVKAVAGFGVRPFSVRRDYVGFGRFFIGYAVPAIIHYGLCVFEDAHGLHHFVYASRYHPDGRILVQPDLPFRDSQCLYAIFPEHFAVVEGVFYIVDIRIVFIRYD